jgi:hypothetical protein
MKNYLKSGLVAISSLALAGSALAAGPDFSTITTNADLGTASTAVMTIAGGIMLVLVAVAGFKFIKRVF